MRSLNYLAALLPVINSAYAGLNYDDGTVIVTTTRTVTVCPIEFWGTCDDNDYPATTSSWTRSGAPPVTTTTSSDTESTTWTSTSSNTESTTWTSTSSNTESTTWTSTSSNTESTTWTSTSSYSYDGPFGNGTTTSHPYHDYNTTSTTTSTITSLTSLTTSINGTTSTSSSSTTSVCFNSTRTAAPSDFFRGFPFGCNRPGGRSTWCNGKSLSDDTAVAYRSGNTRTYTLVIADGSLNGDGTGEVAGFTVNGKTPGDPIIANWGDEVKITVINNMVGNATTIHWHGILQHGTNDQDGVPGVTECGIAPGSQRTYTWIASTYGTGWYHSHTLAQYGGGIRGPIIVHGPATSDYDLDMGTIMIDERWGKTIFNLATQYTTARGTQTPPNYLLNGQNLSPNGTSGESARWIVKQGKKHLFRIINSSVQTAWAFHIDSHNLTVVSADMTPIVPYVTDTLWIHSGQRYNVIVNADQPIAAYDVRAIAQKGCGAAVANDGNGLSNGIMEYEGSCYESPTPSGFKLDTTVICKDEPLASLVPYLKKTPGSLDDFTAHVQNLPAGTSATQTFAGYGPINRWYFGAPSNFTGTASGTSTNAINVTFDTPTLQLVSTVGEFNSSIYSNAITLPTGNTWVYFVIQNTFLTAHPMHLHGHDFSVLGQKYGAIFTSADIPSLNFDNPIRRDTVLLYGRALAAAAGAPPGPPPADPGWTVIGFETDNPGAWVMHCHILWHAEGGMGLQFLERPTEISNYASGADFQSECSALKTWEDSSPSTREKAAYEPGLRLRHLEEHKFSGYSHGHAVRHI